jgi:hypothetical protein
MHRYCLILMPEMVGRPLALPPGCREIQRNEDEEMLEDEGGSAVFVECDHDCYDELADMPGWKEIEPL